MVTVATHDAGTALWRQGLAAQAEASVERIGVRGPLLWLTLGFWLSNYLAFTAASAIAGDENLLRLTVARTVLIGFGLCLCYLFHIILDRVARGSFRRRAITAAILAPIVAEIHAWANYFGLALADPTRLGQSFNWSQVILNLAFWTWFFLAWAALYIALQYSIAVRREEARSAQLRSLAQSAKLRALHNQISPHFLFNCLNSVSALIGEGRVAEADSMIGKLADFLRVTLAVDPNDDIRLDEEIALQRTYLEIEQLRFPDLQVDVRIPDELRDALVPTLILQPLVENAVKHGVAASPPPVAIAIDASVVSGRLRLEIRDTGRGPPSPPAPGARAGLRNVRERLHQRFGDDQSFSAGRLDPIGYRAAIELPLRPA